MKNFIAAIDLSTPRRLHVVGVGGPGMSAIAQVLVEMGHMVSGSDILDSAVLDRLRACGVAVITAHDAAIIEGCDAITASTAIPATNIEINAARERSMLVLTRAQMLASICALKRSVAVAGTHGKTTTCAMLMHILSRAMLHPSFVIGGDVHGVQSGAHWGSGEVLVVEADESDSTHLALPLAATILTNVDVDHLDHFETFANVVESFDQYLAQISGPKVLCGDDETCRQLAQQHDVTTYGITSQTDIRAVNIVLADGSSRFDVELKTADPGNFQRLGAVAVPLRGQHNVLNALGALTMAMQLGVSFGSAAAALESFGGVARRFDVKGVDRGVTFVDDYAHLPNEISAVLRGARDTTDNWSRVVAVFQPNRFNRMSVMSDAYADAFVLTDVVVVTDIYSSGTLPIPGVTGKLVVDAIKRSHPDLRVEWVAQRDDLVRFLASELVEGDLCISMGCGDVANLPAEVIAARQAQRAAKITQSK
ncbi:MAG: UDP-N-acetylmuramate--L-alanine ligase [Actinobacteria bacterium]|nr:MAG: UDP-N-acetylmuramate--L-alanine ligase [Actinomycetota bacterium]